MFEFSQFEQSASMYRLYNILFKRPVKRIICSHISSECSSKNWMLDLASSTNRVAIF